MKKATLSENLKDLEKVNFNLLNAVNTGLPPEVFAELIRDYKDILENVRLAYNDEYPGIINGIQSLR
nr:hypothetical protein [Pedobacter panaciterrae]